MMAHTGEENKKTLIINYLPQTMKDSDLTTMFSGIGKISTCKIVRDKSTGYSYGFGFVEYEEEAAAARAIQMLNGTRVQNKTIKVAYSRQGEKVKGANLYVRNLPKEYTVEQLQEVFTPYGTIIQCRIIRDESGQSKGIGFVLFNTRDEAELALSSLHGKLPSGFTQPLLVSFAEDRGRTNQGNYIGGTAFGAGMMYGGMGMSLYGAGIAGSGFYGAGMAAGYDAGLRGGAGMRGMRGALAGRGAGLVGRGALRGVMAGRGGGGPMRGFGAMSLRFNPLAAAGLGLGSYGGGYGGTVAEAAAASGGNIVFAYNIGAMTTEQDVRDLFSLYGTVHNVDVIWDYEKNQGKGFAFVLMPDYDEAAYAISQLNGYNYAGKPLQVSFKSQTSKSA